MKKHLFPLLAFIAIASCESSGDKAAKTAPKQATPSTPAAATTAATATTAAGEVLTAEESVLITVTAKVAAIDQTKREVTLRGPEGNSVSFTVDKRVQRLNEVHVGDSVTADYFISVAGELRPPTAEEAAHPAAVLAGAARAAKGTEPAGGVLHAFRVVTKVQRLDLAAETVTLRGPGGNDVTVRARHPENLKKIKLGDTIVVTYTEVLAVSLQKAPK